MNIQNLFVKNHKVASLLNYFHILEDHFYFLWFKSFLILNSELKSGCITLAIWSYHTGRGLADGGNCSPPTPQFLVDQLTLFQSRGQIMPTQLLLALPDFQTMRRLWQLIVRGVSEGGQLSPHFLAEQKVPHHYLHYYLPPSFSKPLTPLIVHQICKSLYTGDPCLAKLLTKMAWHNLLSCHTHKWSSFFVWFYYQNFSCGLTIYCSLYPHRLFPLRLFSIAVFLQIDRFCNNFFPKHN